MNNRQRFFRVLLLCFLMIGLGFNVFAQDKASFIAHAHNDYKHKRPFFDAWEKGFNSIEVDVFLIKGELYVSHLKPILKREKKTFKYLYLEALADIAKNNPVGSNHFYLMIDIKTEANATYEVLKKQLAEVEFMLTKYKGKTKEKGTVTVFLSGNRPIEEVLNEQERFVAIDGRPTQLGKNISTNSMPVVSAHFKKVCNWDGKGEIPKAEFEKLKTFANKIHQEGKKARLWAIPDNENTWKVLIEAGIDFINTDKLDEFSAFMKKKEFIRC